MPCPREAIGNDFVPNLAESPENSARYPRRDARLPEIFDKHSGSRTEESRFFLGLSGCLLNFRRSVDRGLHLCRSRVGEEKAKLSS